MHPLAAEKILESVRLRERQGDYPTEVAYSRETLEGCLIEIAQQRDRLRVPPSAPDTKPDERLAEIRERLAGISPTPWEHVGYFNAMRHIAGCGQTDDSVPHYVVRREGSSLKPNGARADAEFIAHAPEDIAYLLSRVSSSPPEGEDTQRLGEAEHV